MRANGKCHHFIWLMFTVVFLSNFIIYVGSQLNTKKPESLSVPVCLWTSRLMPLILMYNSCTKRCLKFKCTAFIIMSTISATPFSFTLHRSDTLLPLHSQPVSLPHQSLYNSSHRSGWHSSAMKATNRDGELYACARMHHWSLTQPRTTRYTYIIYILHRFISTSSTARTSPTTEVRRGGKKYISIYFIAHGRLLSNLRFANRNSNP